MSENNQEETLGQGEQTTPTEEQVQTAPSEETSQEEVKQEETVQEEQVQEETASEEVAPVEETETVAEIPLPEYQGRQITGILESGHTATETHVKFADGTTGHVPNEVLNR